MDGWYNLAEKSWSILAENWWYILAEKPWYILAENEWYIYVRKLTRIGAERVSFLMLEMTSSCTGFLSFANARSATIRRAWGKAPQRRRIAGKLSLLVIL
jgi:hypothetical protein